MATQTQVGGDGADERMLGRSLVRCRQWLRRRASTGSGTSGCPERYDGGAYAAAGLSTASSSRSLGRWQWQWAGSGSSASGSTVFSEDVVEDEEAPTEVAVVDSSYEVVHHHMGGSSVEVNGVAPGPAEAPGPAMPSAAAIAQIFLVGQPPADGGYRCGYGYAGRALRWVGGIRRALRYYNRSRDIRLGETETEMDDNLTASTLLAVARAEAALGRAVRVLEKTRSSQSLAFRQRADRVHVAQARVLALAYQAFAGLVAEAEHGSRHYRLYLPEEDQAELDRGFSESVLFAAQALSRGFQIRGTERRTPALRDPAALLCASWAAVRHVLQTRCSTDALRRVLRDFDDAWIRFERDLCFAYFGLPDDDENETPESVPHEDEFALLVVLLSETLQRGVTLSIVKSDAVATMDPQVMLALPRLAILHAIQHAHPADRLCFVQSPHFPVFWWFRDYAPQCARIAQALALTPPSLYTVLMRMLAAEEADLVLADAIAAHYELHTPPPSPASTSATQARRMTMDDLESIIIDSPRSARSMSIDCISSVIDCPPHILVKDCISSIDCPPNIIMKECISSLFDPASLKQIYVDICTVADSLHSGPFARPFSLALELVFRMNLQVSSSNLFS